MPRHLADTKLPRTDRLAVRLGVVVLAGPLPVGALLVVASGVDVDTLLLGEPVEVASGAAGAAATSSPSPTRPTAANPAEVARPAKTSQVRISTDRKRMAPLCTTQC
jgi:hypothetical protein